MSTITSGNDTYPFPKHGWTCYHCGDTFTTWGAAEDHFGKTPDRIPGCKIKIEFGEEMGLLMALRKVEAAEDEWKKRALAAEDREEVLQGEVAEYQRIAGGAGVHELRMKLDSMEGKVVTADVLIKAVIEKAPEVYAAVIG